MYYSFNFAASVTRVCMEEIRLRGLSERKIFRKTIPNNGLFIKVFGQQSCTQQDLSSINIHSVATLMQDVLWSSHDRIVSKKSWRTINYETCTLSSLSAVISNESEQLLIDILDFLVELMQYKSENLMDAYSLGDALGKVVLGPADCGPIMTEKAGHFLTRMIIEHSKINRHKNDNKPEAPVIRRIDSGFDYAPSFSCHSYYTEFKPLCKQEGTFARAKFYNRVISKTKCAGSDWIENTTGIQPLLDDDYDLAPDPPEKPWISIFTASDMLQKSNKDMGGSPTLFRILREAVKPLPHIPSDPFATSYLFNNTKIYWAEKQIQEAFTEFEPQTHKNNLLEDSSDKNGPLKKLNHSLSHLKLNIKKYRSRHDLLDESLISEDTDATMIDDDQLSDSEDAPIQRPVKMKSMMKKIIKIGGISHQARERYNNKISV